MCRAALRTEQLVLINDGTSSPASPDIEPSANAYPPRKSAVLLKLLKDNPTEKTLVFSNHDNPFLSLADDCEQANIKYKIIKGNSNSSITPSDQKRKNRSSAVLFVWVAQHH